MKKSNFVLSHKKTLPAFSPARLRLNNPPRFENPLSEFVHLRPPFPPTKLNNDHPLPSHHHLISNR